MVQAGVNEGASNEPQATPAPASAEQTSPKTSDRPAADESPEQARRRELVEKHGAEAADAILTGVVLKEMTTEQVLLARGTPERKEVIPPDAELWHYPAGEVAFSNGKVTYVGLRAKSEPTPGISKSPAPRQRVDGPAGQVLLERRVAGAMARIVVAEPTGAVTVFVARLSLILARPVKTALVRAIDGSVAEELVVR